MGLFGKKKSNEKTILVLDIENGSVGGALVRLSPDALPKLFSEKRIYIPTRSTRDSFSLVPRIQQAVRETLAHAAQVAARVRTHPSMGEAGEVSRIVFFLHAPWVSVGLLEPGKVSLDAHDDFLSELKLSTMERFEDTPVSFQAFSSRVPHVVGTMFDDTNDILLVSMTGEVTELSKVQNGVLTGHATIPLGSHTFMRTLSSHAGMTDAEARSALQLLRHQDAHEHAAWGEAFRVAGAHVMEESRDTLRQLVGERTTPHGIYVVAPGPLGEWFARAVGEDDAISELFPEGSSARAVHAHHAKPFLAVHSTTPDVPLSLEVLSIDARMSGI